MDYIDVAKRDKAKVPQTVQITARDQTGNANEIAGDDGEKRVVGK